MGAPTPRVDVWDQRALVAARLGRVGLHAHAAGAMLLGVDGEFSVREVGQPWRRLRHAFVPARVRHELDCGTQRMFVLLLAPGAFDEPIFCNTWDLPADAVVHDLEKARGAGLARDVATAHAGDAIGGQDLARQIDGLVGAPPPTRVARDARVDALARTIGAAPSMNIHLEEVARRFGMSSSRLRHVFAERAGVSLRELRRWHRMRGISRVLAAGETLTSAALIQGFADSAQLSRDFRATFGVPPTRVFRPGVRVLAHEEQE